MGSKYKRKIIMKLNYKWEALNQHPEDESYYWTDLYTQFGVFKIATNRTEAPGEFAVYSNGNLRPKKIVETIEEGKEWVNKQLIEKTELVLMSIQAVATETTFMDRLLDERNQLDERVGKLGNFILSDNFEKVSEKQQGILKRQVLEMCIYLNTLNIRIADLEDNK